MRKINAKNGYISWLLLSFTIAVVVLSLVSIVWLYVYINGQNLLDGDLYVFSPEENSQVVQNGSLAVNSDQIISASNYWKEQITRMNRIIPVLVLLLVVVLAITLLFIWCYMRWLKKKKLETIYEQIINVSEGITGAQDPMLEKAYQALMDNFEKQLNDYKKLTAYLSHEQKNELAILKTRLELSGEKEEIKNVDNIIENISDVITLTEIDGSDLESVDVVLICAEVCDQYQFLSNINFEFEEEQSTLIKGKYRWIYRAVANLVDNAIKYGNHHPILVKVYIKHGSVIILVEDKGVGISEKEQLSIFNNNYRINELKSDGYGIGLSVVSHVCNLCGGFVSLDSIQGRGSTFYLSFPQVKQEP